MNLRKYVLCPIDGVFIGPQIFECIISCGNFALYDFPTGNDSLCYLSKIQPSHILFCFSINGKPFTISFVSNNFNPPKFKFQNMKFRSHESSCTSDWNVSYNLVPLSSFFLTLHGLTFPSLQLRTLPCFLSSLNAMSDCAYFVSYIACNVFL